MEIWKQNILTLNDTIQELIQENRMHHKHDEIMNFFNDSIGKVNPNTTTVQEFSRYILQQINKIMNTHPVNYDDKSIDEIYDEKQKEYNSLYQYSTPQPIDFQDKNKNNTLPDKTLSDTIKERETILVPVQQNVLFSGWIFNNNFTVSDDSVVFKNIPFTKPFFLKNIFIPSSTDKPFIVCSTTDHNNSVFFKNTTKYDKFSMYEGNLHINTHSTITCDILSSMDSSQFMFYVSPY